MQEITNHPLFTELTPEESATTNGGCRERRYRSYRPVRYYNRYRRRSRFGVNVSFGIN